MNVTKAVVFAVSLALMGCATTGERQAAYQADEQAFKNFMEWLGSGTGAGTGFVQGYSEDAAVEQARRAAALQAGILLLGISRPPPPPMPVTCVRRSSNGAIVICQ